MRRLDLVGLKCPLPALRTSKALRAMMDGELLEVICSDPLAGIDVPNAVRELGDRLESSSRDGDISTFLIRKCLAAGGIK